MGKAARSVNILVFFWYKRQREKFLFLVMDREEKKGEEGGKNGGKER